MAAGTVFGIISIVTAVASAAASGISSYQQGKAAEKAADVNAKNARAQARASEQQAAFEARRLESRRRRLLASQVTAGAKSGIDVSTMGDVVFDSAVQGELDRLAIIYKGDVAANRYRAQADYDTMVGKQASRGGTLGMFGSILSGSSSVARAGSQLKFGGE